MIILQVASPLDTSKSATPFVDPTFVGWGNEFVGHPQSLGQTSALTVVSTTTTD